MAKQVAAVQVITDILPSGTQALQTALLNIGPSDTNSLLVTATFPNWGEYADNYTYILQIFLQAVQDLEINQDVGFNDEFAFQVIAATQGTLDAELSVTFKILRLDVLNTSSPPPQIGWGQNLWASMLVTTSQEPAIQ